MARGAPSAPALDMSKFFSTNYHCLIPEPEAAPGAPPAAPELGPLLDRLERGQRALGAEAAVPMVVGPVTFALLARSSPLPPPEAVARLLPAYRRLLRELAQRRVPELQLHEPALATSQAAEPGVRDAFEAAYAELAKAGVPLNLVVPYADLDEQVYPWAVRLPVATLTLDFLGGGAGDCAGTGANRTLELITAHGFPHAERRLGAGVVDGRSVWADRDGTAASLLRALLHLGIPPSRLAVTSSVSLQHLPYDTALEGSHMPARLEGRLAFAVQKLDEIVAAAATPPNGGVAAAAGGQQAAAAEVDGSAAAAVAALRALGPAAYARSLPFGERRGLQLQTHAFPTTTIGSFPQTLEVRRLRQKLKAGTLSRAEYEAAVSGHIAHCVGIQEGLGIDVLVHGEAERTDMVEYFGEKLGGMWFSAAGWVQSYGSRCVRPPVIEGDIAWQGPMTTWEYKVAQSFTSRPVKGMLTGPVTILNWSFPRKDVSREAQAAQLAAALRAEVAALEAEGCRIIQVDEPALREGLPLKRCLWAPYLAWAVDAFRLATAVAAPGTQVVTHLCYSDFEDILPAIDAMDADVLTIENARSGDAMIKALVGSSYGRDVGPGVYDVHSPEVPSVEFIRSRIRMFMASGVAGGRADRVWVNPDCGLKTRGWAETLASLRNMVEAAAAERAALAGAAGAEGVVAAGKKGVVVGEDEGEGGCANGGCCGR
ncbi:hypothetical protein HYH03_008575 [Edaphochlamys debaryana]|uniref:5-methyltetrahydropteroyltriglutamate--homocysteine S-methyltransferase n=1 Tax=Edaphochlamys debaryana TaxID=47281 RepID=A0A836BXV2_9CHLO|nr:hypothetical protein HYH03_008575 [Edaphochlamys debaryana]|eukprot:KAG2493151.1 hypothetical protein HYH03_008575 [Edaphochlamys debaryana]